MNNVNSFLVQNKIITIDQIKEVSEYLKKTLNYYKDQIAQDYERNNNASFYSGHYKYYVYVKPSLEYKIEYTDGRKIDTQDEYVFLDALNEPQFIYKIEERLYIAFEDNEDGQTTKHCISISLLYTSGSIYFTTQNENMNNELYNMSSYINGIFNSGEDRFNSLIKHRFFIKNVIGLAAGSILTLLGFIILLFMKNGESETINMFFENPIMLTLGGWLIAFAFGSTIVGSIVNNLYNNIEDNLKEITNTSTYKDHYEDNYKMFNEVMIGKNYNNLEKRKSLENIYSVSKKVVLVRLGISLIILLVLSII